MAELFSRLQNLPVNAMAVLYMVLGCVLISFGPFFVEFSNVDAMTSSFYRMFIGAFAFLLIASFRKEEFPKARYLWLYFFAGLMICLDLVTCNQSILYIGSGLSTVLSNLEVIFLLILGLIFFDERLPYAFIRICVLMLVGVCLLMQPYFVEVQPQQVLGIFFALLASFIYSVYLLLLKLIGKYNLSSTPATTLGIVCLFGASILGIYMTFNSNATFYLPNEGHSILCIFAYSVLSQVFGWWFITNGLKYVSLSVSGVIFLTQPALTFILDCLFLGRNRHLIQILGGVVLLLTVYYTVQRENSRKVLA